MAARGDDAREGQGGAEQVAPRRHGSARDKEAAPRRAGGPTAAARGMSTPLPAARGGATESSARWAETARSPCRSARARAPAPPPGRAARWRCYGDGLKVAEVPSRDVGTRARGLPSMPLSGKPQLGCVTERMSAPSGCGAVRGSPLRRAVLPLSPCGCSPAPRAVSPSP